MADWTIREAPVFDLALPNKAEGTIENLEIPYSLCAGIRVKFKATTAENYSGSASLSLTCI